MARKRLQHAPGEGARMLEHASEVARHSAHLGLDLASVRTLRARRDGDRLAGEVDLVARGEQRLVGQRRVGARVAHRQRAAVPAAVAGRRDLADVGAVHQDRLAAPGKRRGIVERRAAPAAWCGGRGLRGERVAADERRRLVHLDREAEPGLPRRLVGRQLGAPGAAAGLDAQRVDRVVAGVAQAEFAAGAGQRIVERHALVGRDVELVARDRRRSSSARRARAHGRRRFPASSRTASRPSTDRRATGGRAAPRPSGPSPRSTDQPPVTSTSAACSSSPMCRSIHAKSRVVCADPVTMKNSDGASRITVRSLSKPPRAFSIAV